jgi:glycosyltransferase involved in cell wall biosynthesis
LLTIGHSYAVAVNRRLPHALGIRGDWDVTVAAPGRFRGDFRDHELQAEPGESFRLEAVPAHVTRPVHVMFYGRRLRDLLQEPWDVVHCWEEPYVASAAQIANTTKLRVPLVFATFQNIVKKYPPPFNWIERSAMERADGLIAFGQTARRVLDERGWQQPVRTIPPGVDVNHFRADAQRRERVRQRLGWKDDVPVIGFVGRLVPEKGVKLLTSVLDRVKPRWRALFIGSGPLEADLRSWSRQHGDRVHLQTSVAHADVPSYLNAMDMLCAPSQTTPKWREQFGRMLTEAFACGVPVIASNSGEIPHVVRDAGVIVGEADRGAWAGAIESLLDDQDRRADLARRGRSRAEAVYAWPVVAGEHLNFFKELTR